MKKPFYLLFLSTLVFAHITVAAPICKDIFSNTDVNLNQVIRLESKTSEAPVRLSKRLAALRENLLSQVGPTVDRKTRETNVKIMESFLRAESYRTAVKLRSVNKNALLKYDLVIVGTGPHALFALAGALKKNPDIQVLIISKDDTAGATFREGYVFNINSSNKPSGKDSKPLPGLGNINELPNLPVQVSDLTSVRYPEAADLGDALVTNAYALLKAHKGIDLLFESQIPEKSLQDFALGRRKTLDFTFQDPIDSTQTKQLKVLPQYAITATGLGTPKKIDEFIKSDLDKTKLRKIKKNGLSSVITFEEFVRLMGDTESPWKILENLKIAVVAPGDSGNVTMEFLLGLASQSAYGSSVAQEKVLKQIAWIGQPLDTCKKFLDKIRNRYSGISSGYKSSDSSVEPPLKAYPEKLVSIVPASNGRARANLEYNLNVDADLIILANGFDKLPEKFEGRLLDLKAQTSVSEKAEVLIAKTNQSQTLFVTGPSVRLPTPEELKGVIQNFVSLFNNAPRSTATGEYVGKKLAQEPIKPSTKVEVGNALYSTNKMYRYTVQVEGIENLKKRDFAENPYFGRINNFDISTYLKSSLETTLSLFDWSQLGNGTVKIKVKRIKEGFEIFTEGFNQSDVVAALAYNRDFLSPLLSVLNENVNTVNLTTEIVAGKVNNSSTKITVENIDTKILRQTAEDVSGTILTRLPQYIRGLFADQSK